MFTIFAHIAPAAIVASAAAYMVKLAYTPVLDILATLPV